MAPSVRRQNPTISGSFTDEDVLYSAMEYLRVNGRDRWFLYLHLMDIHEYTYDEDSAAFGTRFEDIYDNAILRTNFVLERLYEYMKKSGQLENTIMQRLNARLDPPNTGSDQLFQMAVLQVGLGLVEEAIGLPLRCQAGQDRFEEAEIQNVINRLKAL